MVFYLHLLAYVFIALAYLYGLNRIWKFADDMAWIAARFSHFNLAAFGMIIGAAGLACLVNAMSHASFLLGMLAPPVLLLARISSEALAIKNRSCSPRTPD